MSNHLLDELASSRNGHAILQRLKWLEDRVYWLGELNRSDLTDRFGISPQQASADIAQYQKIAPTNLCYDKKMKQYVREDGFAALFEKNYEPWLKNNAEERGNLRSIQMTSVSSIKRTIPNEIVQALSRAYRHKTPLSVVYHSKSSEPEERVICPHNIVQTDLRWHVRAWDALRVRFVDLVPSRILKAALNPKAEWVPAESDTAWNTLVDIVLIPSNRQPEEQKRIIERDYQMTDGRRILPTRECLAYYQLSAMHLIDAVREHNGDPVERNYGIAVENWQDMLKFI